MTPAHVILSEIGAPARAALFSLLAGQPAAEELRDLLAWCRQPGDRVWLLAHCVDGVTWGLMDGDRAVLSCGKHPRWATPQPSRANLLELRLFGAGAEALVWRDGNTVDGFLGRLLVDVALAGPTDDEVLSPQDDVYLLAASRFEASCPGGFTVVAEASGRTQIVPLALASNPFTAEGQYPLGLALRHYFERDEISGCVRIAASRLVDLGPFDATRTLFAD